MKKVNLVQMIAAIVGLVAVVFLSYFSIGIGILQFGIKPIKVMFKVYPIFLLPAFSMIVLFLLSFAGSEKVSMAAGAVVFLINIFFIIFKSNIVLTQKLEFILDQAGSLIKTIIEKVAGDEYSSYIEQFDIESLKPILMKLLHPGIGCYLALGASAIYTGAGLLPQLTGTGSANTASYSNRGKTTATTERHSRYH